MFSENEGRQTIHESYRDAASCRALKVKRFTKEPCFQPCLFVSVKLHIPNQNYYYYYYYYCYYCYYYYYYYYYYCCYYYHYCWLPRPCATNVLCTGTFCRPRPRNFNSQVRAFGLLSSRFFNVMFRFSEVYQLDYLPVRFLL